MIHKVKKDWFQAVLFNVATLLVEHPRSAEVGEVD